ncbi:protein of unknown function [Clostridium beijerinckii]|nr:protein of unknown function [Clostridium beijerinckii]
MAIFLFDIILGCNSIPINAPIIDKNMWIINETNISLNVTGYLKTLQIVGIPIDNVEKNNPTTPIKIILDIQ